MNRVLGLVLVALLTASVAGAQASSSDAPATKEDIEKLFTTMRLRERVHQSAEISVAIMRQALRESLRKKYPDLKPNENDRLDSFIDHALKAYDFEAVVGEMIPVYQRHLSQADVIAMLAFYNTVTGQKLIKEMPAIMGEATQASKPRMERAVAEIMDQAKEIFEEARNPGGPASK